MNDGFTGIDIEQIRGQLDCVVTISVEVVYGYQKRLFDFFEKLRKYWASENAYNFGIEATTLINGYLEKMKALSNELMDDLYTSLLNYIKVLGLNDNVTQMYNGVNISWTFVLDAKNTEGVSGMNIRLVEELLAKDLPSIKGIILSSFDNLPNSLSFLDEVGMQQSAYTARIKTMRSLVEELSTEIENKIRSNIEIEKNNILLAKQQVVQNMNGGSGTTNA